MLWRPESSIVIGENLENGDNLFGDVRFHKLFPWIISFVLLFLFIAALDARMPGLKSHPRDEERGK